MYSDEKVDIKENSIYKIDSDLLAILLFDRTTNKNILWATDMYESHGIKYSASSSITIDQITGRNGQVIKPRTRKSKIDQEKRIKSKAEVFTPAWICNEQNNIIDSIWFEEKNVFNVPNGKSWKTNKKKISFNKKTWKEYVEDLRLEISCGEAPYLVSRYDATNGTIIDVIDRVGLLDRKLRIVNENCNEKNDWLFWCENAYKSIYGYEWQGDSLLIARENLLYTFIDNYYYKFKQVPTIDELKQIAYIISWNIFQMDGIKFVIPNSCKNEVKHDYTLFGDFVTTIECEGCKKNRNNIHNGIYVKIMNWSTNRKIKFISLFRK